MIETKFKQTELCRIPEDWDIGTFADFLITFSAGATPYRGIPDNFVGTIPWISSGELNYCEIENTREHISSDAQKNTHLTLHKPGTFLIAITGLEAAGTRGRCAFVKTPATTNQSCLAINSTDKMTVKYLFWFYRQWSDFLAFNFSQGSKQQSFTAEIVKRLPLYAPKYKEQEKIAEALSDVDKLIRELDTLIEKKRAVMQGTMQELLTAHRRLPGFVHPWRNTLVEKCCKITTGESNTRDQIESGIYPFYIRSATVMRSNSYIFDCEGVITIGDGQIGKVFHYVNGKFDLHQRCYLMYDFDNIDVKFFYFLFSFFFYNRVIALSAKATVDSVRRNMIAKMKINIPSTMQEQKAIANILSDMNDGIEAIEAKRDKYIAVRQGMMQQLLTGKIRLI